MNTREQYLNAGVSELSALFKAQGYELPEVKVSCSWPGGGSANKCIGECWARSASAANINEVFISPRIDNSIKALDILTHELIHAIDDCQHGHRAAFTKIMRAVGLEGKPTATVAGERLHGQLETITDKLGEYPHKKLTPPGPKQKSRQLKAQCKSCGAIWRMAKTWITKAKACPVCLSENILID